MAKVSINIRENEVSVRRKTSTFSSGLSFDIKEISIKDIFKLLIRKILCNLK